MTNVNVVRAIVQEDLPLLDGELFVYGSRSKFSVRLLNLVESSDWDYAVQYSTHLEEYFKERLDWVKQEELDYQDATTMCVYSKTFPEDITVQISLRDSLSVFKMAWESISGDFYWKYINKRSPTAMPSEDVKAYLNQLYRLTLEIPVRTRNSRPQPGNIIYQNARAALEEPAWEAVREFDAAVGVHGIDVVRYFRPQVVGNLAAQWAAAEEPF